MATDVLGYSIRDRLFLVLQANNLLRRCKCHSVYLSLVSIVAVKEVALVIPHVNNL